MVAEPLGIVVELLVFDHNRHEIERFRYTNARISVAVTVKTQLFCNGSYSRLAAC
jgi:hypothetical protein